MAENKTPPDQGGVSLFGKLGSLAAKGISAIGRTFGFGRGLGAKPKDATPPPVPQPESEPTPEQPSPKSSAEPTPITPPNHEGEPHFEPKADSEPAPVAPSQPSPSKPTPFQSPTRPTADDLDKPDTSSPYSKFMLGKQEYSGFKSSNVAAAQYDPKEGGLEIGFKNGGWYRYHDVSPTLAKSFYDAGSKGKWVWDKLRLRGTVFGHQKPYVYLGGKSQGYTPKYAETKKGREQHRTIGPEGMTPLAWRQGKGPYHPSFGLPKEGIKHPWGDSPEEIETRPGQRKKLPANDELQAAFKSDAKSRKSKAANEELQAAFGSEKEHRQKQKEQQKPAPPAPKELPAIIPIRGKGKADVFKRPPKGPQGGIGAGDSGSPSIWGKIKGAAAKAAGFGALMGGMFGQHKEKGGDVEKQGGIGGEIVYATPGERVFDRETAQKNLPLLESINQDGLQAKSESKPDNGLPVDAVEGLQGVPDGGSVAHQRGDGGDTEPVKAKDGAFVVNKDASVKHKDTLDAIAQNKGEKGGLLSAVRKPMEWMRQKGSAAKEWMSEKYGLKTGLKQGENRSETGLPVESMFGGDDTHASQQPIVAGVDDPTQSANSESAKATRTDGPAEQGKPHSFVGKAMSAIGSSAQWMKDKAAVAKEWMKDRYGAKTTAVSMAFGQAATWGASAGLTAMTGMPIMLPPGSGIAAAELYRTVGGKKFEKGGEKVSDWRHPGPHPGELKDDQFVKASEYDKKIRSAYFNEDGTKKSNSSRTTPNDVSELMKGIPVGSWRVDDTFKGNYGRDIDQLREFSPEQLAELIRGEDNVETNAEGRGWDADRYAEWMMEGKEAPPINVVELENGKLKVSDGHRRHSAAMKAKLPLKAWVSPMIESGKVDYEGKPMKTGLTDDLARKHAEGKKFDKGGLKQDGKRRQSISVDDYAKRLESKPRFNQMSLDEFGKANPHLPESAVKGAHLHAITNAREQSKNLEGQEAQEKLSPFYDVPMHASLEHFGLTSKWKEEDAEAEEKAGLSSPLQDQSGMPTVFGANGDDSQPNKSNEGLTALAEKFKRADSRKPKSKGAAKALYQIVQNMGGISMNSLDAHGFDTAAYRESGLGGLFRRDGGRDISEIASQLHQEGHVNLPDVDYHGTGADRGKQRQKTLQKDAAEHVMELLRKKTQSLHVSMDDQLKREEKKHFKEQQDAERFGFTPSDIEPPAGASEEDSYVAGEKGDAWEGPDSVAEEDEFPFQREERLQREAELAKWREEPNPWDIPEPVVPKAVVEASGVTLPIQGQGGLSSTSTLENTSNNSQVIAERESAALHANRGMADSGYSIGAGQEVEKTQGKANSETISELTGTPDKPGITSPIQGQSGVSFAELQKQREAKLHKSMYEAATGNKSRHAPVEPPKEETQAEKMARWRQESIDLKERLRKEDPKTYNVKPEWADLFEGKMHGRTSEAEKRAEESEKKASGQAHGEQSATGSTKARWPGGVVPHLPEAKPGLPSTFNEPDDGWFGDKADQQNKEASTKAALPESGSDASKRTVTPSVIPDAVKGQRGAKSAGGSSKPPKDNGKAVADDQDDDDEGDNQQGSGWFGNAMRAGGNVLEGIGNSTMAAASKIGGVLPSFAGGEDASKRRRPSRTKQPIPPVPPNDDEQESASTNAPGNASGPTGPQPAQRKRPIELMLQGGMAGALASAMSGGDFKEVIGSYFSGSGGVTGAFGRTLAGTTRQDLYEESLAKNAKYRGGFGGGGESSGGAGAELLLAAKELREAAKELRGGGVGQEASRLDFGGDSRGATDVAPRLNRNTQETYNLAGDTYGIEGDTYGLTPESAPMATPAPSAGLDVGQLLGLTKTASSGAGTAARAASGVGQAASGAASGASAAGGAAAGAGGMAAMGGPAGIALAAGVAVFSKIAEVGGKVVDVFVGLTKAAMDPAGTLRGLAAPIQSQVGHYNPGIIERFNLALDNASAAVGYIFTPVIEGMREFADEINVVTTGMGPGLRDMVTSVIPMVRDAMRGGLQGFSTALRAVTETLTPIFQELQGANVGGIVAELFRGVGQGVADFVRILRDGYGVANELWMSLSGGKTIIESAVDALRLFTASLSVGRDLARETAGTMAGWSRGVVSWLGEMKDKAMAWGVELINMLPTGVRTWFGELYNGIIAFKDGVMEFVRTLPGSRFIMDRWAAANARMLDNRPETGPRTIAAQQARHIGIEEVGMEARRSAFSQGSDAQRTADNTAQSAATLRQIQTLLAGAFPGLAQAANGAQMLFNQAGGG